MRYDSRMISEPVHVNIKGHRVLINRPVKLSKISKSIIDKSINVGENCGTIALNSVQRFGWKLIERGLTKKERNEIDLYRSKFFYYRSYVNGKGKWFSNIDCDEHILPRNSKGNQLKAIWGNIDKGTYKLSEVYSIQNDEIVKDLPEEMECLFGQNNINGHDIFVKSIWFRTDKSSCADNDIIDIYGTRDTGVRIYDNDSIYCEYMLRLFRSLVKINSRYVRLSPGDIVELPHGQEGIVLEANDGTLYMGKIKIKITKGSQYNSIGDIVIDTRNKIKLKCYKELVKDGKKKS